MAAVYPDARNAFAHPELLLHEGLEPWVVPEVWLSGGVEPNTYVDITDTFDRKVTALRQHVSQNTGGEGFDERMRTWTAAIAKRGGLGEGRLAEVFQVVGTA